MTFLANNAAFAATAAACAFIAIGLGLLIAGALGSRHRRRRDPQNPTRPDLFDGGAS